MNTVGKLSAAQGLNDPKMVEENAEEQWLVLQTFSSCSFVCLHVCVCVCECVGMCLLPDPHSVIVPFVPGLNNSTIKGKDCFFSLFSFLFLCVHYLMNLCVCVFVYAWLVLWDKR